MPGSKSAWKNYYDRSTQPKWSDLVPYHVSLSLLMFAWNKFCLYSWNFMDIFIIIYSRALYYKFKLLLLHTRSHVVCTLNQISEDLDRESWERVTKDFETLYSYLDASGRFLSPMIFVSYATNLYFVILHLHMGITPLSTSESPAATEVYRTWAFVHIVTRMFLVTLSASRIADYADEFIRLYRKCPPGSYTTQVRRMERFAKSIRCSLTGLNCFFITKPFMLSLVGVVFTFEIVLLQTSGFGKSWRKSVPN